MPLSGGKRDAFQQLMASSKKSKKLARRGPSSAPSRLVSCPVCQAIVPDHSINSHLDNSCFTNKNKKETIDDPYSPLTGSSQQEQRKSTPVASSVEIGCKPDAFSHMMKQSQENSRTMKFHLCADYSLTWTAAEDSKTQKSDIVWSSTVRLRGENRGPTELIISTSIPEPDMATRLVQQHSKLSVPVLKSILQKSVRRRRPLPAARIAMELADKAMGELLRRLPIIMFEDSTLHSDLPLLCWLMAAESKQYRIPSELMVRVLQVVFEISSCPWKDQHQDVLPVEGKVQTGDDELSLFASLILKSIQMRASYGGMACDMRMLQNFSQIWYKRFQVDSLVPDCISQRFPDSRLSWQNVSSMIHDKARAKSLAHILSLTKKPGLLKIEEKDVCLEGVDFHCSGVLDTLLSDSEFVHASLDRLQADGLLFQASTKDDLRGILKRCIWDYSSGVNHRQSLLSCPNSASNTNKSASLNEDEEKLKKFWHDAVARRTKEYMARYVKSRLAT